MVVAPFSSGELVALRQENGRVLWSDSLAATRRTDELAAVAQIHAGPVIGVCAESHCKYLDSLAFPDGVDAGLRVAHLGRSSVRYEIGLFVKGSNQPAAEGFFVHVYVDRATQKQPTPLPPVLREALAGITLPAAG